MYYQKLYIYIYISIQSICQSYEQLFDNNVNSLDCSFIFHLYINYNMQINVLKSYWGKPIWEYALLPVYCVFIF